MSTTTSLASPTDPHRHAATDSVAWQPGRVDWFDAEKGFGFLVPDRGGPAVFCDFTAIDSPGYKTLRAGQRVVFTATDSGRGPEAVRILTYDESALDASSARLPKASRHSVPRTRRALAA
ncbi:cold shock domain-containing protein [Nocardia asteroides]|uniref:cold-shock protein n=1 Tax=Nocardia asteroides TaxID=1824 RepID=UPI002FCE58B8